MQSRTSGFDRARLAGAGPAPPIQRMVLHGYLEEMVGGGPGAERRRRGFRIRTADILLRRGRPVPRQPRLPPFVLGARVDHHGPISRPVERDLALRDFLGRPRPVRGRLRVGEDADLLPGVVRHGLGDEPPTLALDGWEASDAPGGTERGEMVLRHQCGIGDIDGGPWGDPRRGQERGDVRQDGVMHGFIRGIAILRVAPPRDGTLDTPRGEDAWLQGRALVLALALGEPQGSL